jgi:hypothetical protein
VKYFPPMMRGAIRGVLAVACLWLLVAAAPAAAKAKFSAHGSVTQVYVTGAKKGKSYDLLDSSGGVVQTKPASRLGGIIYRKVDPGKGYRVRRGKQESGPLTVMTTRSKPANTDFENQQIPESGYGYLTTRDGTKLAIDVHPPSDVSGALPTGYIPPPPSPGPSRPAARARSRSSATCWATRSSTSTCAARAARAGRSTSSSPCRAWTATT